MVKNACSDQSGLRKGTWTPEEDKKLIAYVTRYGHWNWNLLPKFAGLERCGKSCRLRWLNYLRPNIKRGNYTKEEDETIINMRQHLGNRWSAIAAQLPGRTDNEIKNYWHTNLKKRYQQNSHKHFKTESKDESPIEVPNNADVTFQNLGPISESTDSCTIEFSIATDRSVADVKEKFNIPENEFAFVDAYNYQEEPMNESFWSEPYLIDISCVPCETLVAEPHYLSPLRDVELWSHDNNEDYYALRDTE